MWNGIIDSVRFRSLECYLSSLATPLVGAFVVTQINTEPMVTIPVWLEMLAVAAAAAAGALSARRNDLDLVAAVILAILCALGGGLLRDMILQVGSVYMLDQPLALPFCIVPALIAFLVPNSVFEHPISEKLIFFLDILAVGLYSATGTDKAIAYGYNPLICITMGVITGVCGGMLRDNYMAHVPGIFIPGNLYALASLAGSVVYFVMLSVLDISNVIALTACVVVVIALRYLSVHYDWRSPSADVIADKLYRHK